MYRAGDYEEALVPEQPYMLRGEGNFQEIHAFRAYTPLNHSEISSGGEENIFGFMVQHFVFMIK